jgi:hypothetical protein
MIKLVIVEDLFIKTCKTGGGKERKLLGFTGGNQTISRLIVPSFSPVKLGSQIALIQFILKSDKIQPKVKCLMFLG